MLLAEDESSLWIFLQEFLEAEYEVEAVTDGEQAWAAVQRQRPDLVLADFQMPLLDGIGLTRRLRADVRWATLPIIFLTGRIGEDTRLRCLEAGASAFMAEPFRPLELLACLRAQLSAESSGRLPGSRSTDKPGMEKP